jgi:hypothetical protein
VFSIPYIYDFIVGIVTIVLLWRIAEFNEKVKQMRQSEESQKLLNDVSLIYLSKMKNLRRSTPLINSPTS